MKAILWRAWGEWKEIGHSFGEFQARLLLTFFYFTVLVPFGMVACWLLDPLRVRRPPGDSAWVTRESPALDLDSARRQF